MIGPLVSEIIIFKLILIRRFQNVPCALGFEVKIRNFSVHVSRACIIILGMPFFKNDYGQSNLFSVKSILKIIIQALKLIQKYLECLLRKT